MLSCDDIGLSYARHYATGGSSLCTHDDILGLGYSEEFFRKWIFYFTYCQAGFEAKYIHTWQLVFTKINSNETQDNIDTLKLSSKTEEKQGAFLSSPFQSSSRKKTKQGRDKSKGFLASLVFLPYTITITVWMLC